MFFTGKKQLQNNLPKNRRWRFFFGLHPSDELFILTTFSVQFCLIF